MLYARCDNCDATESARQFLEPTQKRMWCEPATWLRRFDAQGLVIATFCSVKCEKAFIATRGGKNVGKA